MIFCFSLNYDKIDKVYLCMYCFLGYFFWFYGWGKIVIGNNSY